MSEKKDQEFAKYKVTYVFYCESCRDLTYCHNKYNPPIRCFHCNRLFSPKPIPQEYAMEKKDPKTTLTGFALLILGALLVIGGVAGYILPLAPGDATWGTATISLLSVAAGVVTIVTGARKIQE